VWPPQRTEPRFTQQIRCDILIRMGIGCSCLIRILVDPIEVSGSHNYKIQDLYSNTETHGRCLKEATPMRLPFIPDPFRGLSRDDVLAWPVMQLQPVG
jgi:hypothetical protein